MAKTSNSGKTLNVNYDVMSILPTYVHDYITNFHWNISHNLMIQYPSLRLLVMQVIIPAED